MEVEEVTPSARLSRDHLQSARRPPTATRSRPAAPASSPTSSSIVAPGARGAGFTFAEVVKGGAVPRNYIPAVEQGAHDAMERGPLGFPVVDVAVTLTDGLHHPVDSSEMAFRIAGRRGVGEALKAAGPVLLQPLCRVAIHAPALFTGSLGPIIASHAGQVSASMPTPPPRDGRSSRPSSPAASSAASPTTSAPPPRASAGSRPPSTTTRRCTERPPTGSSRNTPANRRRLGMDGARGRI